MAIHRTEKMRVALPVDAAPARASGSRARTSATARQQEVGSDSVFVPDRGVRRMDGTFVYGDATQTLYFMEEPSDGSPLRAHLVSEPLAYRRALGSARAARSEQHRGDLSVPPVAVPRSGRSGGPGLVQGPHRGGALATELERLGVARVDGVSLDATIDRSLFRELTDDEAAPLLDAVKRAAPAPWQASAVSLARAGRERDLSGLARPRMSFYQMREFSETTGLDRAEQGVPVEALVTIVRDEENRVWAQASLRQEGRAGNRRATPVPELGPPVRLTRAEVRAVMEASDEGRELCAGDGPQQVQVHAVRLEPVALRDGSGAPYLGADLLSASLSNFPTRLSRESLAEERRIVEQAAAEGALDPGRSLPESLRPEARVLTDCALQRTALAAVFDRRGAEPLADLRTLSSERVFEQGKRLAREGLVSRDRITDLAYYARNWMDGPRAVAFDMREHEALDRRSGSMVRGEKGVIHRVGLRMDSLIHSVSRVVDGVSSAAHAASDGRFGSEAPSAVADRELRERSQELSARQGWFAASLERSGKQVFDRATEDRAAARLAEATGDYSAFAGIRPGTPAAFPAAASPSAAVSRGEQARRELVAQQAADDTASPSAGPEGPSIGG